MTTHQMRTELVEMMKKTVDRFNISSETYYHAVLLFNVIQLKKTQDHQPEYFTVPIKKINFDLSSDSDSECEGDSITQPCVQYITVHHTQMPQKDKLDLTVCLFLVHKLYEPYPLCLSYLLRHLGIDERFQEYIISLEKEFLVKLAYKIQNMLPSNQTLFACQLWDEFTQNISSNCIDIRFGITSLFQSSKKQIRTAHQINRTKIQPEFKTLQNQQTFDALSKNIQILVHNRAIYDLYIKKSVLQNHQDVPSMKKIGLAITYVTILQQTNMIFSKKYRFNQKQNSSHKQKKTDYMQFVFNDFLESHFGMNLQHLNQQVSVVLQILENKHQKQSQCLSKRNTKFCSIKNLDEPISNKFSNFLLRVKEKSIVLQHHYKYHRKCKGNMSISSTKTDKQKQSLSNNLNKSKCHSILGKESINSKNKNLESTLHQSNISQKAESFTQSIYNSRQKISNQSNHGEVKKFNNKGMKKSAQGFDSSGERSSIAYTTKTNSNKHGKSLMNSNRCKKDYSGIYKVSQFISADV